MNKHWHTMVWYPSYSFEVKVWHIMCDTSLYLRDFTHTVVMIQKALFFVYKIWHRTRSSGHVYHKEFRWINVCANNEYIFSLYVTVYQSDCYFWCHISQLEQRRRTLPLTEEKQKYRCWQLIRFLYIVIFIYVE